MRLTARRVTLFGILQAAAFLVALFSLATLPNHLHLLLELFSHFRLQYLVVALLLGSLFAVLRQRNWLLLMVAVTAINAWTVLPWYYGERPDTNAEAVVIEVLLANVAGHGTDPARFIELVSIEQPDIVFMQEIEDRWAAALTSLRDAYPHQYAVPRADNFGIAVIARQPFLSVEQRDGPPIGLPSLIVELAVADHAVTFVSTHPKPPLGGTRIGERNRQLADIAEVVAGIEGPVVLIGDLNTTMWAAQYRQLVARTGLTDAREGVGLLPTWPTFLPIAMIPIDHCLISPEGSVREIRTGPRIGSDHLPLLITLAL